VTFVFELLTQFLKVVYLSIENNGHRAVFVEQWLIRAVRYVDDRKAAMGNTDVSVDMDSRSVRTAVCQRVIHRAQRRR
jgi:hypothetical protein